MGSDEDIDSVVRHRVVVIGNGMVSHRFCHSLSSLPEFRDRFDVAVFGDEAVPAYGEEWKSEHGNLPLPAQMFRMGAEMVTEQDVGFTYALLSKWPVNKQNEPKTDIEVKGLDSVAANGGKAPFYGTEPLGGKAYFTALYADVGVAAACIDCHNEHEESPRRDFELGDVMGGVVLRIPLEV